MVWYPKLHTALSEATPAHSMVGQSPPPPILNAVLSSLETYTELHTTTATHLMTAIAAATVNPDRIVRKSNIKKKIICMSVCLFHEFQNRIGD